MNKQETSWGTDIVRTSVQSIWTVCLAAGARCLNLCLRPICLGERGHLDHYCENCLRDGSAQYGLRGSGLLYSLGGVGVRLMRKTLNPEALCPKPQCSE